MAYRIGDYIVRGELRNTRANGVYGWIEFATNSGIHIELTGNFKGRLAGKHFKFKRFHSPESHDSADIVDEAIDGLADRQIGVVGDILLRKIRVPTVPIEQFLQLSSEERERACEERNCLYLEWFSQNGRVVAEIVDPDIEFVDIRNAEDVETPEFDLLGEGLGLGITEVYLDSDGNAHFEDYGDAEDSDSDDDPYGLFSEDLEQSVAKALGEPTDFGDSEFSGDEDEGFIEGLIDGSDDSDLSLTPSSEPRRWDEVIPGIDDETKAMYEQWDEIFEGRKDEPVSYLFETPLKLPPVDKVSSDAEAEGLVTSILAQLALLSVAVDVCEHYTPLQTYHLLMTEILPTAKVHPNLAASRMVQHYSTSDYCEACDAELDEEYEADDRQ